jgi:shikimate kinase
MIHVLHVLHPFVCRYAFFDTDNVIERAHPGETVSDIFKKYGEDYFRQCEEQVGPQGAWEGGLAVVCVLFLGGGEGAAGPTR